VGFLNFGNKFHVEETGVIARVNPNFLEGFGVDSIGKRYPDLTVFGTELARHWNPKFSVFDFNPGYNQKEVTVFREITREFNFLLEASRLDGINQAVEAPKSSIDYLKGLLGYIGVQPLIVLVPLAVVIVRFVVKVFPLLKVILPNRVKSHVLEVLTQSAKFPQGVKFPRVESAYLVFLSQVHSFLARTTIILARSVLNVKPS
jgi:hypothetical protein